jgi:hypothetical protein
MNFSDRRALEPASDQPNLAKIELRASHAGVIGRIRHHDRRSVQKPFSDMIAERSIYRQCVNTIAADRA